MKKDTRNFLPKIDLEGWKGSESRTIKFLDDGVDYTGEYGVTYIFSVEYENEPRSLWVREMGPLRIGLQPVFNEFETFKGKTIKITKTTGKKPKDTRYTAEILK